MPEKTLTKKLLDFLEKDRFTLTTALIYVFIIAGIRSFFEAHVGEYHGYGRYLFTQHVLLSFPELLMAALVIYIVTKRSPKKIMNVFLLGWGLLLIPPFFDYLIYGARSVELGHQYEYFSVHEIIPALVNSWNPIYIFNLGSRGQGVMFLSLMIGTASYIALITRFHQKLLSLFKDKVLAKDLLKRILQIIAGYFGIYLVVWFIGSFKYIIRMGEEHYIVLNRFTIPFYSKYYVFFKEYGYPTELIFPEDEGLLGLPMNLITNQNRLIYSSFFIILTIITLFILLYLSEREKLRALFTALPKRNMVLSSLSAFIGITSIHMVDPDFSKGFAIDPTYLLHMPYVFFSILTVILLVLFCFFMYHYFSWKRGSGSRLDENFSKYHYFHLSASCALSALYFSMVLGYISFALSLVWISFSIFVFSKERNVFRKDLKLVIFGLLSFLHGFYTPNAWRSYIVDRYGEVKVTGEVVARRPPMNWEIFLILIWIMISFYVIARISDVNWDEIDIFSSMNKSKNQYMISVITFFLLLFPLIYFGSFFAVLIYIGPAVATPIWYKILKRFEIISSGFVLQMFLFSLGFLYLH
ncbi:MAG: hypothetical protein KGY68_05285 [Candidatus Thermoplasmatota archaeon]|nr:hypothetical protein [Candidatus Thermoplasmatota archaeon]